jgi:hypothetical protein
LFWVKFGKFTPVYSVSQQEMKPYREKHRITFETGPLYCSTVTKREAHLTGGGLDNYHRTITA